ncbi:MAG: hypothetical protein J6V25_12550 [Oscillospiraceae bacterium]|nr:hypothetical protein [Oscillospiraceae bacterium]
MKKCLIFLLCICLLPWQMTVQAYSVGSPFHAQLDDLIANETRREYVQMMIDYYMRTDPKVQAALKEKGSAVFLFEGCSDNMDHPDLSDISYYRVSAVCIVIRLDDAGEPYIVYFNDQCSTLPDRPLEYGAWHFDEVGDVGPATICDGTYELYSVYHAGSYEALHVRTDYEDQKVDAVYMTPEGYIKTRATEINIHTRTGNHILKYQMWSAGCMLVGGGDWGQFTELIDCAYYTFYDFFQVDQYVGSLTVNRQFLKEQMYALYENEDAVDMLLANTRQTAPEVYLRSCVWENRFADGMQLCVRGTANLMTLPCSNPTDARSLPVQEVTRGQELTASGIVRNDQGRLWYEINYQGQTCYLYTGYAEESSWRNWITRIFA